MPNKLSKCNGWCPPTVIYLVLAVATTFVSLMTSHKYDEVQTNGSNKVLYTLSHLVVVAFWTWVLYWLCSNCHYTAAWVVLLFPVIIFVSVLIYLFVYFSSIKVKSMVNNNQN